MKELASAGKIMNMTRHCRICRARCLQGTQPLEIDMEVTIIMRFP
jgi:hypothetical protein